MHTEHIYVRYKHNRMAPVLNSPSDFFVALRGRTDPVVNHWKGGVCYMLGLKRVGWLTRRHSLHNPYISSKLVIPQQPWFQESVTVETRHTALWCRYRTCPCRRTKHSGRCLQQTCSETKRDFLTSDIGPTVYWCTKVAHQRKPWMAACTLRG